MSPLLVAKLLLLLLKPTYQQVLIGYRTTIMVLLSGQMNGCISLHSSLKVYFIEILCMDTKIFRIYIFFQLNPIEIIAKESIAKVYCL